MAGPLLIDLWHSTVTSTSSLICVLKSKHDALQAHSWQEKNSEHQECKLWCCPVATKARVCESDCHACLSAELQSAVQTICRPLDRNDSLQNHKWFHLRRVPMSSESSVYFNLYNSKDSLLCVWMPQPINSTSHTPPWSNPWRARRISGQRLLQIPTGWQLTTQTAFVGAARLADRESRLTILRLIFRLALKSPSWPMSDFIDKPRDQCPGQLQWQSPTTGRHWCSLRRVMS